MQASGEVGQIELGPAVEGGVITGHEIDWDAYASRYDLLATNNPSYHQNIEILRSLIPGLGLPRQSRVCDVGAGTGNYICALAKDLPEARFWHLDADEKMNSVARGKYSAAGLSNVEVHTCAATEAAYPAQSFDLVICVNALYAIQPREEFLRKVKSWLRPGGTFFVIDIGRPFKVWDWARYILAHVYRRDGMLECVRFFFDGLETLRQNRRGSQGQLDGIYWLHSAEEFQDALEAAGFVVEYAQLCYRGYCDLAVCRSAAR